MELKFEDVQKKLEALYKQAPDVVIQESVAVLKLITARLESEVIKRTPAGVGGAAGLRGSIFGEILQYGNSLKGIIGTPLEYAIPVEYGRKPGKMPPQGALLLWVQKKLGVSVEASAGVEFLVRRKIGKKGTKGAFMFTNAWRDNQGWVDAVISSIPDRVLNKIRI